MAIQKLITENLKSLTALSKDIQKNKIKLPSKEAHLNIKQRELARYENRLAGIDKAKKSAVSEFDQQIEDTQRQITELKELISIDVKEAKNVEAAVKKAKSPRRETKPAKAVEKKAGKKKAGSKKSGTKKASSKKATKKEVGAKKASKRKLAKRSKASKKNT